MSNRTLSNRTLGWIVALLVVVSIAFTMHAQRRCARRGGVLVRNAWNWPTCVAGIERR